MSTEGQYAVFLHLTYGLRAGLGDRELLKLWPTGKHTLTEIANVSEAEVGRFLSAGGLGVVGNEDRLWANGYEERVWNPALLPGLGENVQDRPGHDWANIAHHAAKAGLSEASRLAEGAGHHLRGASHRLMHISEWYHQMLLYAHLRSYGPQKRFSNLDMFHFLLDCHSFLVELGSARDYLSAFAGKIIGGLPGVTSHRQLLAQLNKLKGDLRYIIGEASEPSSSRLTLAHVGKYRNLIVHQRPLSTFSRGLFETFELGIEIPHRLLGVRFEITANPLSESDKKYDCLKAFQAMMRVVFKYARDIAALSPIDSTAPIIESISVRRLPMQLREFP